MTIGPLEASLINLAGLALLIILTALFGARCDLVARRASIARRLKAL